MKITKTYLKQLIKEEIEGIKEVESIKVRMPSMEEFKAELKELGLTFPDDKIQLVGGDQPRAEIMEDGVRVSYEYSVGSGGPYAKFYATTAVSKEQSKKIIELLKRVLGK